MIKIVSHLHGNVVLSFWLVQNLSYEQMTKRGNRKKDSEQVGMTEGMPHYRGSLILPKDRHTLLKRYFKVEDKWSILS